ncbi:UDP-glucose 4-epimerase GalE [Aliidiomarina indica]|uniref:UDP-glucose 4-epimerase GalE n=1 Tax=Aliidiomarina indica TaxID=2749147 RepID=UPI00188F1E89|nr:UDP-glucose 4-epimerase GalE [Aliidiomarina indica]
MTILVTGGAGYIGSHTVLELLNSNQQVLVLDNYSNSTRESLERVTKIAGRKIDVVRGDIRDASLLKSIFSSYSVSSVVHFAGLKSVGESVEKPLEYYDNNVVGTRVLLDVMNSFGLKKIVFSSSATVYGDPAEVPIREGFPTGATTNPYGTSKHFVERMLMDLCTADPKWHAISLRYFNPVGAHSSGLIGEDPNDIPNNLMPYVSQVAVGKLKELSVFGNDYSTHDGTGVRDYIHVVDLALGHLAALNKIESLSGFTAVNLGTGKGHSVLDMVQAFENITGKKIPYKIVSRRPGDIAICYADPSYAEKILAWKATRGLSDMIRDTWNWQSKNPNGYKG